MSAQSAQSAHSLLTSITTEVETWSERLKGSRMKESLQATISLVANFNSPVICSYLISERIKEFEMNTFTTLLKTVMESAERMYKDILVGNLQRVLEERSIISDLNFESAERERRVYQASLKLMEVQLARATRQVDLKVALEAMRSEPRQFLTPRKEEQVEEDIELMKFFEGIRRYQDEEEDLAKKSFERLRLHKQRVVRNVQLMRGFKVSELKNVLEAGVERSKRSFFLHYHRTKKMQRMLQTLTTHYEHKLQSAFTAIGRAGLRHNLLQMLEYGANVAFERDLRVLVSGLRSFRNRYQGLHKANNKMQRMLRSRISSAFRKIIDESKGNSKRILSLANSFIVGATNYRANTLRRAIRIWHDRVGHPKKPFLKLLVRKLNEKMRFCISELRMNMLEKRGAQLSYRMKGRILTAVVRHEKVVDVRRAFLCWYTRTNDQLIREKIVSVLLNARINTFTAYARLHNAVVVPDRYRKVSSKMRFFLMIFLEKANKFQKFALRKKFQVWRQKSSQKALVNRLLDSFERLEYFLSQLNLRQAFLRILKVLNESRIKKRFFLIMFRNSFADVRKGFNRWKKLPDRKKLNRQAQLKKIVKGVMKTIFDQKLMVWTRFMEEYEIAYNKKVALLSKSFALDNNYMQKYLYRWRTFINYSKFQQKTLQQQKEAAARTIVSLSLVRRRWVLAKFVASFRQGLVRKTLITRYFRRMQQTANRNVSAMLSKMRSLLLTDHDKEIKALRLETALNTVFRILYRRPIEQMKTDWTDGQEKKLALTKRFVQKLSCRLSHSIELLQNNAIDNRLSERNAKLLASFSTLSEIYSKRCLMGMLNDREIARRKASAVATLVKSQRSCLTAVIAKWRQSTSDHKTLLRLQRIHLGNAISIAMTNRTQRLRELISQHYSKGLIVKKLLNRFVKAHANDQYKAFFLMKTLPVRPDLQRIAKANKFTNGLYRFYTSAINSVFQQFKAEAKEGEYSKRRCLNKMLEKTGDIRRRKLMIWKHMVDSHNQQLQCKLLMDMFLSLSNCAHTNLELVLVNPAEWIIKEKAFLRLSKGLAVRKSDAFNLWKTTSRNLTLAISFDNEKKIILTKMLEDSINSTRQKSLREAIAKFYKNSRILKMQHNFFQRLMDTQFGKVIKGFHIWKNLPELKDRELIAKATRFQNGLERFLVNKLRITYKQFSEKHEEGLVKKKECIRTLIHKCCKGIARYFEGWKNDTRRDKLFSMCTKSERMLTIMNATLVTGLQGMFVTGRKQQIALKLGRAIRQKNEKTYFRRWRHQHQLSKQAEKFKMCHRVVASLNDRLKLSAHVVLAGNHIGELTIKQKAVVRLVNAFQAKQRQFLLELRDANKRERIAKTQAILYLKSAMLIIDRHHINQQLRAIIGKFRQNTSLKKTIGRLYGILSQHGTVRVAEAFNVWKALPDAKEIKKRQQMLKAITRGIDTVMKEVRSSFEVFRNDHREGELRKRDAAIVLANSTVRKVNRVYSRWNESTRMHRTITICRKSQHFFQELTHLSAANLKLIFENPRELALKEKYLTQLFAVQQGLVKDGFTRWLMNHRSEKLNSSINNTKKSLMIASFNQLLHKRDCADCKRAVHQFYLNWKITQCQTNFIKKLLTTKGGRVVEAFRIWKELPQPNQLDKVRKAQKLFFVLRSIANSSLMQAFRPIKEENELAELKKKRAILQLFDTTSSGIRKFYGKWLTLTKKHRLLTMCKLTHNFLQELTHVAVSNMQCFLESEHEIRLKEKYIGRLVENTEGSLRRCLQHWAQVNRIEKMQRNLEDKKKRELITLIEGAIGNERRSKLKEAVKMFHLNYSIARIGRNFFNKLLQTKSGMTVKAFEIWKNLPEKGLNVKKIKAIKFLRGLEVFYDRPLRSSFETFKQMRSEAENRQKLCINKLLKKCMSYEQRKYLHWKTITKELALMEKTRLLGRLFRVSFEFLSDAVYNNLVRPARYEMLTKRNICRRMISSSISVQGQGLSRWVEAYRNDQVRAEEMRTNAKQKLTGFIRLYSTVRNDNLRRAVGQFRSNRLRMAGLARYFERVNSCRQSAIRIGFTKWLRIDDGGEKQLMKQKLSLEFLKAIEKYMNGQLASFFMRVKESYKEGVLMNKFIRAEQLMSSLHQTLRSNLSVVLRNPRDSALMTKALNRIVENTNTRLRGCLMTWLAGARQKHLEGKLIQQKKRMLLQVLEKLLQQRELEMLPKVVRAFYKNYKIAEVQRRVLKKILNCSAGKIAQYFLEWKNLPDAGEHGRRQRLSVFERGLDKYYRAKLKFTYDAFKSAVYEGDNRKKHAVRKLVLLTMSDSNRMFGKWRQLTTETKILARAELLQNLFGCLHDALRLNLSQAVEKRGTDRKLQAVKQLMVNNTSILWQGFDIWRGWSLTLRNNHRREHFGRLCEILSGRRVYVDCFLTLKKNREMNVLRNYINSLWRWKTSNIEAQYYTKFINVFRESEELLSLSRILNSKINAIYGHVFRKLQASQRIGADYRTTVVAKYLGRRAAAYFNEFKRNLKQTEVSFWKKQFQSSIKGMSVLTAFERSQRKFTCYVLKQWKERARKKTHKLKACYKLRDVFVAVVGLCWSSIQQTIQSDRTTLGLNKINALVNRSKQSCFRRLRKMSKFASSIELLQGFLQDSIAASFKKIEQRSHTRPRLSILLQFAELAISAKRCDQLKRIVSCFKSVCNRTSKLLALERLLHRLQLQNFDTFFVKLRQKLLNKDILRKYRAVHLLSSITDRRSSQLTHKYLLRWREHKVENPWTKKSMLYFATRSSINSSLAVSLWRLKHGKT